METTTDTAFRTRRPSRLSDTIGRIVTDPATGGRSLLSAPGPSGHLLYGPYELRLAGRYRITFDLGLAGPAADLRGDPVCAVLEIVSDEGRTMLAERPLRASDLAGGGRHAIDVALTDTRRLEYRIETTGRAGLRVGDTVRVAPLPGRGVRRTGSIASAAPGPCFVGCATDPAFVGLTATMLASVDEYGCVPDAVVLVADFGLSATDRAVLRAAAGRLGPAMRFVGVDRDSPLIPVIPDHPFPFPLIGRFVLPKTIDAAEARLILIDSDMILTDSLRPLFEVDMEGHPVAAVLDPMTEAELVARGRALDPSYFNAGLVVIDIPRWNTAGISDLAMRRWAAYPERPYFLDQDALNAVIGDDWLRLDRCWNFFYAGEAEQFSSEAYESAPIVHFAGAKPDLSHSHPAIPLYDRQVERVAARTAWARQSVDRSFVTLCYEMFLGREPESPAIVADRVGDAPLQLIATTVRSDEFRTAVHAPLRSGERFAPSLFRRSPTLSQLYWIADRLPLFADTAAAVVDTTSWRQLLQLVLADGVFREATGLPEG